MAGRVLNNLIEVRQGDSFDMPIHLTSEGKDLDISGFVFKMQIRNEEGNIILSKTGEIADALRGRACMNLNSKDTSIPTGDYLTDIQVTFANGQVHTIFPQNTNTVAIFRITEQVTK